MHSPWLWRKLWLMAVALGVICLAQAQSPNPASRERTAQVANTTAAQADSPLLLATNITSAYSSEADPDTRKILPQLSCIFKTMGVNYRVKTMPWRRAYQEVKNNRVDGFFTAIPARELEPYAVLSAPLLLENWYWFWRSDTVAPESWRQGYKLGSILGSQQETWLEESGYHVDLTASNLPQLIKLLKSKRIDVLLADQDYFEKAARELALDPGEFQSRFIRYVPLGVSFNETFLNKSPGFLPRFNAAINLCNPEHFALSPQEQQRMRALLSRKLERWRHLPGLDDALRQRNKTAANLSVKAVQALDAQWMEAFAQNNLAFAMSLVNQPLSAQLREIKKQADGLLTEIIVADRRGLNLAISDITSDYWQGDESKFTAAFAQPSNSLLFGEVAYDESSKHFQVQLSLPLNAEADNEPLGVMILGVDVERALAQLQ